MAANNLPNRSDYDLALVLSGGNALGSYQAGGYEALHEQGLEPDWVVGASAGSMNGALICGSAPDQRIANLKALWSPSGSSAERAHTLEDARRTLAAAWTFGAGHPGIFTPRRLFGPFWNPFGNSEPSSLYDATPIARTMARLVDFDLLNRGAPRFCATAVDIESGEEVVFDTRDGGVGPDEIRASCALLPAFAPVEIDGRMLGDGGLSLNLPLDKVLAEHSDRPLLCIALDLLPLRGARPQTLGETILRMQDVMFAAQSRRAIAAWQAIFDERVRSGTARSVTLLHIPYWDQGREVSGKAFDFSAASAGARWQSGREDLGNTLRDLAAGKLATGAPGLSVYSGGNAGRLERVHWSLNAVQG